MSLRSANAADKQADCFVYSNYGDVIWNAAIKVSATLQVLEGTLRKLMLLGHPYLDNCLKL